MLQVVNTSQMSIEVGDFVVVTDSNKKLKTLQDEKHGGWNVGMRKVYLKFVLSIVTQSLPFQYLLHGQMTNSII